MVLVPLTQPIAKNIMIKLKYKNWIIHAKNELIQNLIQGCAIMKEIQINNNKQNEIDKTNNKTVLGKWD